MRPLSFKRHRFPAQINRHSVWLYARFTLSFRDIEDLLAERGVDVSYETDAFGFNFEWTVNSAKHIPFDWSGP